MTGILAINFQTLILHTLIYSSNINQSIEIVDWWEMLLSLLFNFLVTISKVCIEYFWVTLMAESIVCKPLTISFFVVTMQISPLDIIHGMGLGRLLFRGTNPLPLPLHGRMSQITKVINSKAFMLKLLFLFFLNQNNNLTFVSTKKFYTCHGKVSHNIH